MKLTPRQTEVRDLICRGLCDKEIASELGISFRTVKFHVHELLARYGVNSRRIIMHRELSGGAAVK